MARFFDRTRSICKCQKNKKTQRTTTTMSGIELKTMNISNRRFSSRATRNGHSGQLKKIIVDSTESVTDVKQCFSLMYSLISLVSVKHLNVIKY